MSYITMRAPYLFVVALAVAAASTVALADPHRDNRGGDKRAVRDVVNEVERNYRGHVIDVQPPAANEDVYRVRVLQEGGRVKTVHVPAKRDKDRNRGR